MAPLRRLNPAIGTAGLVWSAVAAILGLFSFAIIFADSRMTRDMIEAHNIRVAAFDVTAGSDNLNKALIAILGTKTDDRHYGQTRTPLGAWTEAARQLRSICARSDWRTGEVALHMNRACDAFNTLDLAMVPALTDHERSGAAIDDDLIARLAELVRLADAANTAARGSLEPRHDTKTSLHLTVIISTGGFLLAVVILFLLVGRSAARHHEMSEVARRAQADAQASRQQVIDAIEAVPVGFALYDQGERLVLFNRQYNETMSHLGGVDGSMIGWTLERIADHFEGQLRARYPDHDLTQWKAGFIRRAREAHRVDFQLMDGRMMRLQRSSTTSGGRAMVWTDVSDLIQRQEDLRTSERRFQMLVDSLTDTVFSLNRDNRITYLSAGIEDLLGFSVNELRLRVVFDVIHPDDHALLDEVAQQLRANRGLPASFTCRMRRKDGAFRRVEIRLTAPERRDNLNGEFAITGLVRDIEVQHELASRLHDRMERLNSIVQSTGALFLLIDRDQRVVMANNGFLSFVGLGETQVVDQPFAALVDWRLDPAVVSAWLNAGEAQTLKAVGYDNTLVNARGERRHIHVTANPVRGTSGRVEHIVLLGVDETERRQAELQLFDASRLATLGEMASGIAHEINQPLTVIRFATESLQDELVETADSVALGDLRDFIDEKCARVIGQTERAATIIRDLRGFARKPDDATESFDVGQALRIAAKMVDEQLRLARIELHLDLDPVVPPVTGHASRLQQVIINLILNARDAILDDERSGAGTITIRVRALRQSSQIVLVVEDDGPGIPDHVLPRLFEPFFTTKPTGKGTGLGLSISYQIIQQMRGTIAAENRAEGGARFTMTFDTAPIAAVAVN
ncbi:MAG TPA: PAS domain S-box protein [Vineibacter sp.]|nr:PAS domain S-box protein [Vineibacter sp.]